MFSDITQEIKRSEHNVTELLQQGDRTSSLVSDLSQSLETEKFDYNIEKGKLFANQGYVVITV